MTCEIEGRRWSPLHCRCTPLHHSGQTTLNKAGSKVKTHCLRELVKEEFFVHLSSFPHGETCKYNGKCRVDVE